LWRLSRSPSLTVSLTSSSFHARFSLRNKSNSYRRTKTSHYDVLRYNCQYIT
jgi:hypothetical protein